MERVPKTTGDKFERLVAIMATLRGPNGCPWDKEQDFNSLKPMLVEEVYEVLEAVENNDFEGLSEELGDLLLHVLFNAQLAKESGRLDRKSTRLNSSHVEISYAVFCLKKKKNQS